MQTYIILALLFASNALLKNKYFNKYIQLLLMFLILIIIGFRYEIGGDWNEYLSFQDIISKRDWLDFYTDPIYQIINKISYNLGFGIYGINFICALLGIIPTYLFINKNKNCNLALFICFTYFFCIIGMGYTRQFAATGLFIAALLLKHKGNFLTSILFMLFSIGFHSSSLFLIPFYLWNGTMNKKTLIYISSTFLLFFTIYFENVERIITDFIIINKTSSSGSLYRTILHLLASISFFLTRKNVNYAPEYQFKAYSLIAILSFFFILISPNSSAIDRILVYFFPFQAVALANFKENLFFKKPIHKNIIEILFILFFAILFFTWLNYSKFKNYWVPYKSILVNFNNY